MLDASEKQDTHYPPETAGRLMAITAEIPVVSPSARVADVHALLRNEIATFSSVDYLYVCNPKGKLVGVFSIRELFARSQDEMVSNFMIRSIITVHPYSDRERAALLALKHNIKAIPVVDKENILRGVLEPDTILEIIDSEAIEDILRFGGVYHKGAVDDLLRLSLMTSLKHRLPWLLLGLLGGLFAAGIVRYFETTLSEYLILASFIPLVVYMAGAVSAQMVVFIVRDLVINPKFTLGKYARKQFAIVASVGILMSALLTASSYILYGDSRISFVLGITLFIAILSSLFTGLVVPYLFYKLKFDPANASGPIATIIQDVLTVFIYLSIASFLL